MALQLLVFGYTKLSPHTGQMPLFKGLQRANAGEGVKKRGPSYAVGGNVNWCSHYGEHYGGSLKNEK